MGVIFTKDVTKNDASIAKHGQTLYLTQPAADKESQFDTEFVEVRGVLAMTPPKMG